MSSKSRKRSSSRSTASTIELEHTQSRVAGAYVPTRLDKERARTSGGNLILGVSGILIAVVLVWAGLRIFSPGVLPEFLRVPMDPAPVQYAADGRISFLRSNPDGGRDLYVINPDGSNQQQVTSGIRVDGTADWSPDGRHILVQANVDGVSRIIRVTIGPDNKPTETPVQLTADIEADSAVATWSPDGSMIAFQSKRDGGNYQVFVMNADSSNKRRLSDGNGYAGWPAWSPDGKSIAYVTGAIPDQATTKELHIVSVDGGAPRQITQLETDVTTPKWSPDGKHILCVKNVGDQSKSFLLINLDDPSAEPTTLVEPGANNLPQFSPQGDKIAYYSVSMESGSDVYTVPVSGGEPTSITGNTGEDYWPTWSPDGKRLAWSSRQGEAFKIAVGDADGSNTKVISRGDGSDFGAVWGPPVTGR